MEGGRHVSEASYELSIVGTQPKELSNLMDVRWFRPVVDCFNLSRHWAHFSIADYVAAKFNFLPSKFAFRAFRKQLIIMELFQYLADMIFIFFL
jgi:hypothetical protein